MTAFRVFPLSIHSAIETLLGLTLMAAPFAIGVGAAATVIAFVLGALITGVGLSAEDGMSISSHFAFDQAATAALLVASLTLAIDGDVAAALLLGGFGVAHLALTTTTRYTRART